MSTNFYGEHKHLSGVVFKIPGSAASGAFTIPASCAMKPSVFAFVELGYRIGRLGLRHGLV